MKTATIILILLIQCFLSSAVGVRNSPFYTAGVYEHVFRGRNELLSLKETIIKNLQVYEEVSKQAAVEKVDILVFPEYGLDGGPNTKQEGRKIFSYVPDPSLIRWNPCLIKYDFSINFALRNLSCMARRDKLVLVVNVISTYPCNKTSESSCPDEGSYLYNTNVVFDQQGYLISRYYKINLYFETGISIPKPNMKYFDTNFGRFGSFICFDILFEEAAELVEKYNVKNIIFPTYWFDQLPLLNALEIQAAWSYKFNVNFLSSNHHYPVVASLGSGIFNGKQGLIVGTNKPDGIPRLLITRLPKNPKDGKTMSFEPKIIEGESQNINSTYINKKLNMANYSFVELVERSGSIQVCNNGLCCKLNYESPKLEGTFYLASFKGVLNMRNIYYLAEEVCVLVECKEFEEGVCKDFQIKGNTSFSYIELTGNFMYKHVYPSVTGTSLAPISTSLWNYAHPNNTIEYKDPKMKESILSVVLFGRSYENDIKPHH